MSHWLIFALIVTQVSALPLSCLDGCECDDADETIRCDNSNRREIAIPSRIMPGYKYIAFTCNDLRTLPPLPLIQAAFPDLEGLDVQGNPNLNCSSTAGVSEKLALLSDCGGEPFKCEAPQKCDWKCTTLNRLKEMWRKIRDTFNKKMKDWGTDETIEDIQDWFGRQYNKISAALG